MGASAGLEISIEIEGNIYQFCFYFFGLHYHQARIRNLFGVCSTYRWQIRLYSQELLHNSVYFIKQVNQNPPAPRVKAGAKITCKIPLEGC